MRKVSIKQTQGERIERNSLSREKILIAAQTEISLSGDIPSIRALAARLGASPMAIYTHFPNKEALLLEILDQVLGEVPLLQSKKSTKSQMIDFAYAHRNVLISHPWAIPHFFSNPTTGVNSMKIGEHVFEILLSAGVKREQAVAIFSGLIAMNYGWASFVANKPISFEEVFSSQISGERIAIEREFSRTIQLSNQILNFGGDRHYDIVLAQLFSNL